MLIFTRRVGETIRIGDDIVIKNLGCKGDASRIGITAPKSISIDRQEIYEKKYERNSTTLEKSFQKNEPIVTVKKKRQVIQQTHASLALENSHDA